MRPPSVDDPLVWSRHMLVSKPIPTGTGPVGKKCTRPYLVSKPIPTGTGPVGKKCMRP